MSTTPFVAVVNSCEGDSTILSNYYTDIWVELWNAILSMSQLLTFNISSRLLFFGIPAMKSLQLDSDIHTPNSFPERMAYLSSLDTHSKAASLVVMRTKANPLFESGS